MSKEFSEWLKAMCEQRGLSWRAASLGAGLGEKTIQLLIREPERRPTTQTCTKLALFFGMPIAEVLELAGYAGIAPGGLSAAEYQLAQQKFSELYERMSPQGRSLTLHVIEQLANAFTPSLLEDLLRCQKCGRELTGVEIRDSRYYASVDASCDLHSLFPANILDDAAVYLAFRLVITPLQPSEIDLERLFAFFEEKPALADQYDDLFAKLGIRIDEQSEEPSIRRIDMIPDADVLRDSVRLLFEALFTDDGRKISGVELSQPMQLLYPNWDASKWLNHVKTPPSHLTYLAKQRIRQAILTRDVGRSLPSAEPAPPPIPFVVQCIQNDIPLFGVPADCVENVDLLVTGEKPWTLEDVAALFPSEWSDPS